MPYRLTPLVNESYYHVYNRGVEKRIIFSEKSDYDRFLKTLYYYQFRGVKPSFSNRFRLGSEDITQNPKIVDVVCYCLMPNHFHLLLKQNLDNGISEYLRKVMNSYTKYFNVKYKRVGPLFQGAFKALLVENNIQFIHLSRYIHLNPYTGKLVEDLKKYSYSSYTYFIGLASNKLCVGNLVLDQFKDANDYKEFVEGYGDYARELDYIKHLVLDVEE